MIMDLTGLDGGRDLSALLRGTIDVLTVRPRQDTPWLEAELQVVQPRVLVLLGATAAQALLGSSFRVSRQRGEFLDSGLAPRVLATVHPSSILRAPDEEARALAYKGFVADLAVVAGELRGPASR